MAHNYDVGTKAWQPDPTEGWVPSEVTAKTIDGDKIKLTFTLESGQVCDALSRFLGPGFRQLAILSANI